MSPCIIATRKIRVHIFFFLFFCIHILFFIPSQVRAAGQSIRVMTFNSEPSNNALHGAGVNSAKCNANATKINDFTHDKTMKIAEYIKAHNVDVAMIQELYKRCDSTPYETDLLNDALYTISYPMEMVNVPFTPPYSTFQNLAIYSRYHIDKGQVNIFPLNDGNGRYSLMVKVTTDVGVVDFYSIHTTYGAECPGVNAVFDVFDYDPNPNRIMGGDFNANLKGNACRGNITTKNSLAGGGVDYIVTPLNGVFTFSNIVIDGAGPRYMLGLTSEHKPVLATATTTLPVVNTPTPTASPTATPTQTPTPTITPTFPPRKAECNACGYCIERKPPQNIDQCIKCLYPGMTLEQTVLVDDATGRAPDPEKGKYFTQLGCLSVGMNSFKDPSAAGGVLNFLLNTLMFPLVGILAILAIIYGAFLLITAQGDPVQIQKGRLYITGAIVGVLFAYVAILIVKTISSDILKMPGT